MLFDGVFCMAVHHDVLHRVQRCSTACSSSLYMMIYMVVLHDVRHGSTSALYVKLNPCQSGIGTWPNPDRWPGVWSFDSAHETARPMSVSSQTRSGPDALRHVLT